MALKNKFLTTCPFKSLSDGVTPIWLPAAGGTNEFYYSLPDVPVLPLSVLEGGVDMAFGIAGALAQPEWGWGDLDGLGFDTIYVRINALPADPNSHPADYIQCSEPLEVFQATDGVETIKLATIVGNTENSDTDCMLYVTNEYDVLKWIWMFGVSFAESVCQLPQKIVITARDKVKFMCSHEKVNISISEDES